MKAVIGGRLWDGKAGGGALFLGACDIFIEAVIDQQHDGFERFAGLLGKHYGVAPALEVDDDGGSRSAEFFLPNGVYLDLGANQGSVSLVLYSPEEARFLREEQERQSLGMPTVDS